MAATGKTPILLYGSTTATNQPSAGNLTNSSDGCEIAINVADKNLFFKDATNTVNTVPIRQSSASSNGWLSSTDWTAFNSKQAALVSGTNIKTVSGTSLLGSGDLGTIGTGYGGTGLTSFTSGGVVYASSTSALATGSALIFDGSNLGINTAANAWDGTTFRALDLKGGGSYGSVSVQNNGATYLGFNTYNNGSNWVYKINGVTGLYGVGSNGTHQFFSAATGTAGGAIAWTAGLTLSGAAAAASRAEFDTTVLTNTDGAVYNQLAFRGPGGTGNTAVTGYDMARIEVCRAGTNSVAAGSIMKFYTTSNNTGGDAAFAMQIAASGGVSIGNTTDPGATNLSVSGNVVISTSGKGIDFSATPGTGTSELLADYEEGTWTPVINSVSAPSNSGWYVKVGNVVTVGFDNVYVSVAVNNNASITITGLPYNSSSGHGCAMSVITNIIASGYREYQMSCRLYGYSTQITGYNNSGVNVASGDIWNLNGSYYVS